ncbi:MAG: glycosyltransferase [Verrucomicrobiaceae bacterium]|nr:MAG: glycosyltransferase [Verrucomicrobiaceae bacterium]
MSMLSVGVTIATHNRLNDLKRTLEALRNLATPPDEIWICADGCSDGSIEFVRTEYPDVQLIVNERAEGSIPSRNALASKCQCEILLSLDDDSYPVESDFVEKLRALFTDLPRLAVATFPQRSDEFPETLGTTDFGPSTEVASYVNSGAAIRRSVFHALGKYPGFFFHAYEEPDFALRCLAAGWQVRNETSLTIRHHYTSAQRNELRTHHRHSRNELWSVFLRCPLLALLPVAGFRIARQFGYALGRGFLWALSEPLWWWECIGGLPQCLKQRHAVSLMSYWKWMQLMRRPAPADVWQSSPRSLV